jgi:hypothetical protein
MNIHVKLKKKKIVKDFLDAILEFPFVKKKSNDWLLPKRDMIVTINMTLDSNFVYLDIEELNMFIVQK